MRSVCVVCVALTVMYFGVGLSVVGWSLVERTASKGRVRNVDIESLHGVGWQVRLAGAPFRKPRAGA